VEAIVKLCEMTPCTLAAGTNKQANEKKNKIKNKMIQEETAITHRPPKMCDTHERR